MSRIDPSLRDVYELNFLSSLQDQRIVLDRVRHQTKDGMTAIANGQAMPTSASSPGTSASTSTANEDDNAIYNRSPTINHNYYHDNGQPPSPIQPQPLPPYQPTPSANPWWLLIPLVLLVLASGLVLGWLFSRQPVTIPVHNPVIPAPVVPTPAPIVPGREYLDLH